MRTLQLSLLAGAFLVLCSSVACGTTIHVPDGEPTIQAGINAASAGDTVLVSCGIYYEHDIIMKSGVCLISETGSADCVEIDAQQHEGFTRVIHCANARDSTSIVGFALTGGYYPDGAGMECRNSSLTLASITFQGNFAERGGGLYCRDSSVALENVTFEDNLALLSGGGIHSENSSLILTHVALSANTAAGIGYEGRGGGGMYCDKDSSAELTGCTFSENAATGASGGGLRCNDHYEVGGQVALTDCVFSENTTVVSGGGMNCGFDWDPSLSRVAFLDNSAVQDGGGMHCSGGASLVGCTFSGNTAELAGGGFFGWHSSAAFEGCTFPRNGASEFYGGGLAFGSFFADRSDATLSNCIIAFSTGGGSVYEFNIGPTLTCCDVFGNEGGDWVWCIYDDYGINGNFSEDPLFCDMYNNDLTLCANSPCLPDSNDCHVLIGAHGEGCQNCDSPVDHVSWGLIKAMFR